MTSFRATPFALPLLLFACEPIADLGGDEQATEAPPIPVATGGVGGSMRVEDPQTDPRLIATPGEGGTPNDDEEPNLTQGHVCSVVHPGESHPEPIAVCCEMNEEEIPWREQAFFHINETRIAAGLPPFMRDSGLDQAAIAWAMHWHLHWDPVEKRGYPGPGYSPTPVAEACGTTASLIMATDAQDEPLLENGFIDPKFPANYWETDGNLSERFLDPDFRRMGIGLYEGLLVGVMGPEEPTSQR